MRGLANFIRGLGAAFRDRLKSGLAGWIAAAFTLLVAVMGTPERIQRAWFGASGPGLFDGTASILAVLLLLLVASFMFRVATRMRGSTDIPGLPPSNYSCRVLTSYEDARYINDVLVKRIFPQGSLDRDQALLAQKKNNRRLIGLIDNDSQKIVGWAALWPVTADAGYAVERGKRLDDDLTVGDVLRRALNGQAKYLALLTFAILHEYRNAPENPTVRLGRYVIFHIIREFLRSSDRSIRVVAIAYSEQGERLCEFLKLKTNDCFADYGPERGTRPIYVGDVTRDSLSEALGN